MYLSSEYNVICVSTAQEALAKLKEINIDLITLDIELHDSTFNGLHLTNLLRKSNRWNNLPIVAVTAHAFTTDRNACLSVGCTDFKTKPITRHDYISAIRAHI